MFPDAAMNNSSLTSADGLQRILPRPFLRKIWKKVEGNLRAVRSSLRRSWANVPGGPIHDTLGCLAGDRCERYVQPFPAESEDALGNPWPQRPSHLGAIWQ